MLRCGGLGLMSTFAERFLITVLAALCTAIIVANPFKFDVVQRVSAVAAIVCLAVFVGSSIERARATPTEPSQAAPATAVSSRPVGISTGEGREAPASSPPLEQAHSNPRHIEHPLQSAAEHSPEPPHSTDPHRASEPGRTADDPSVWNDVAKLSSTPEAVARREDSRVLQEAYQRLLSAHYNISTKLTDFQLSRGAGGTPDLKLRRVEGIWATPRIGYPSPVMFTKYEIRLSGGAVVFSDMDAGAPFYKTPIDSPNYGDDFVAAVRRSMEPQIRAELNR
jgi:hypothetical protein